MPPTRRTRVSAQTQDTEPAADAVALPTAAAAATTLLSLDQDSMLAIVERLRLRERFRLEITCRALATIIRHPSLWRKVSFFQLIGGPDLHPAILPPHRRYVVRPALERLTDRRLRALLVRMNCVQHIEELWLDGCKWSSASMGSALEVLRGAPKLRRISLFTKGIDTRYYEGVVYPSNFMDAAVVDIVKSFPALQIAHIPQQRLASANKRASHIAVDARGVRTAFSAYEEWDEPWRGLVTYMIQKPREDNAPCGFCSVAMTNSINNHCSECGKRSCRDKSKGCPKLGSACAGCYRRVCRVCCEKRAGTDSECRMKQCFLCERKYCFVCTPKTITRCEGCRRKVCSTCSNTCEGCEERFCDSCAEEFAADGLCPDCDGDRSDEYSNSEDEW